jgi:L-alanine-DL-glutamate epimerase-like enolase superfamily enzyme
MRITEMTITPVAVPLLQEERWAYGRRVANDAVLVELSTDEGVAGLGEAGAYPSARIVEAAAHSLVPLVVGQDPMRIEHIVRCMDIVGTWHHVGWSSPALAAVEMACWDIVGKVCGQPLVNLFGGRVRDSVEVFYYVDGDSHEDFAADAARGKKAGFRTFYVKAGFDDPRDNIARVEAVRDGLGAEGRIRVDGNESWSPGAAVQVLGELERFGLELAEQPVSGRNLTEMAYVRSKVNTPVLANEASWTRHRQLEVIRHAAADAVSVDNQMDGGLLNLKRSAGMCEAAGLPVVKHSLGELGVASAAALHVMASTPNFLYANQYYPPRLADDVITADTVPPCRAGRAEVPDRPGIGVELDRDKVVQYAEHYQRLGDQLGWKTSAVHTTPLQPKC